MSPKARLFTFAGWLIPSRFKYVMIVFSALIPPDVLGLIALSRRLTGTTGSYAVPGLAKRSVMLSTTILHHQKQTGRPCFLLMSDLR
jgi:hypothetical protein